MPGAWPTATATTGRCTSPSACRCSARCWRWPRTFVGAAARFPLLCASAVFVGSGANMGLIVIQRRAGQAVSTSTERMRMFSWLGIAPSLSNVVGPVAAGFMIDAGGFRAAYRADAGAAAAHLVVHPAASRASAETPARGRGARRSSSWTLLARAGPEAAAGRELGAVGLLGRAHVRGADPRLRARLQRHHHRPDRRHLHAGGQRRAPADPAVGAPHQRDRRAAHGDGRHRHRLRRCTRWRIRPG